MSIIWSPAGTELTAAELELLVHPHSSGIILFAYNYESPQQIKKLISQAKETGKKAGKQIIVSVDQEGGNIQRFINGMTPLPSAEQLWKVWARDKKLGYECTYTMGRLNAEELRDLGVNVNYAPVLDLDKGISKVIKGRCFGDTPQGASTLACSYIEGLHSGAITAVGKHFPGHGGVTNDSHFELPQDTRVPNEIRQDLMAFSLAATQLRAIMTSHIVFTTLDSNAASFSRFWLREVLRDEMKYDGVIISDDLTMGAVGEIYPRIEEAAEAALTAGCDLVLICNDVAAARKAMNHLDKNIVAPTASHKIDELLPTYKDDKVHQHGEFDIEQAREQAQQIIAGKI